MANEPSTFEARMSAYAKDREDLMTPHNCQAAFSCSEFGADLNAIEPFMSEFTGIVDKMKDELANEKRILEGTDVPEYVPFIQNELSQSETKEDQWRTLLPHGSSTIGRIHTSTPESNISSSSAKPNSPVSDTPSFAERSCPLQTGSCLEMSGVCGCVTDATNECSECTVPTINEPTPGTPSEVK
jgi:hypothetical protein